MNVQVLFHDNCFDGAASAAVFTRFYRERVRADATFTYRGLSHKPGAEGIDPAVFSGDENAIVDFRYSQDARLTWWFDHHASAFQQPGDEAHFRADSSGRKFHDPHRKSCTKYLADVARERFGWDASPVADLIHWAEIIDGAQFPSPQMAVALEEPALRIMTVLEANKSPDLIPQLIHRMQTETLSQLAASPLIAEPLGPLLERHQRHIEQVRATARYENGVVFFDLANEGVDSLNKFIAYALYPDARYTLWVGQGPNRAKVSLGSNPWKPELRKHDLSAIAGRYGGGGHPVVAAVSFKPGELEKARAAYREILAELSA
ncbi:DHH family phosphoesterase [Hyalangium sp.]|uniref:DHH family phosphoesterase n=1 Tax=Hyalangium sp. TaxID=2028555 RepID=UPI002D73730D|nr:DHH family phosphoesterase [Hyalangium sp.]HYH96378.1 DHH family phosphoesterase [Hyalangium sp.]